MEFSSGAYAGSGSSTILGGQLDPSGALMPSGAIADQRGDRTSCHLRADLGKVEVHALGIGGRRDHRRADSARRADRAEDIGRVMAVIADHGRT